MTTPEAPTTPATSPLPNAAARPAHATPGLPAAHAADPTAEPARLVDRFGRTHHDLRVSLTDRCNLRCTYCMPAEGLDWMATPDLLTADEIVRVVRIATDLGITEVRLTGGEPLIRPDVVDIVARLAALPRAPHLSVTTNGLRLATLAAPLADAGLSRVNVSCDTLSPETFGRLTLRNRLDDVLAGIAAARAAGLAPIKINTVLMRGVNDHEAAALLRWALDEGLSLRFIEQMPLDPQHGWNRAMMVTREEIIDSLERAGLPPRGAARAGLGAGRGVRRRRRAGHGGNRRVGHQSVLRRLRPCPPDGRRPLALLPVRAARGRPAHAPAQRRRRRGHRRGDAG